MKTKKPLLQIESLQVEFTVESIYHGAVNEVSLTINAGDQLAIIGETGSGKSILAAAVMGLLPATAKMRGKILWEGSELSEQLLQSIRGRELVFMPQNPLSSLNPVLTVGLQVREALQLGQRVSGEMVIKNNVVGLLAAAGLAEPALLYHMYPHQLSGGMAQRVLWAIGMAGKPRLVIADEPTKGLDSSMRNRNMSILYEVLEHNALLLITHDLEVAGTCKQIAVMYAGEIVEMGDADKVLTQPLHPYTYQLLKAHPFHGMIPIEGCVSETKLELCGCRFAPRCTAVVSNTERTACQNTHPALVGVSECGERWVRCWYVRG